jgi:DNA-binding beta-propeller fold protein YncE
MDFTYLVLTTQSSILFLMFNFLIKHKVIIGITTIVLTVSIISIVFLINNKKETPAVNSELTRKHEPQPKQTANEETCSPRGTATSDPSGKPLTGGTQSQQQNSQSNGESTINTKILEDVGLKVITTKGSGSEGLDIDPKTGLVYVAHNGNIISNCKGDTSGNMNSPARSGGSTMSIIDPVAAKEILNVATESSPIWPLIDNVRNVVYVSGSGSGKIALHALGSGVKTSTIEVKGKPHALGLDPNTGLMIVSNTYDMTQTYMSVVDVDTKKVIANHKVSDLPHGVAMDYVTHVAYMVSVKDGGVSKIDLKTGNILETFDGADGSGSNLIALSTKTKKLFVVETQPTSVINVINTDTKQSIGKIRFADQGSPVWGMDIDEENGLLYAAIPNANAIGILDINTLKPLGLIKVDECPFAIKLDLTRGFGYSTGQVNGTLSMFDLRKVMERIK